MATRPRRPRKRSTISTVSSTTRQHQRQDTNDRKQGENTCQTAFVRLVLCTITQTVSAAAGLVARGGEAGSRLLCDVIEYDDLAVHHHRKVVFQLGADQRRGAFAATTTAAEAAGGASASSVFASLGICLPCTKTLPAVRVKAWFETLQATGHDQHQAGPGDATGRANETVSLDCVVGCVVASL